MNTAPPAKRRAPRHIVAEALAMVAIVVVATWLLFRYWGIHKALSFYIFCALFNFLLFVALLSFMRWLERKRKDRDPKRERRFRSIRLLLAVAFFVAALQTCIPIAPNKAMKPTAPFRNAFSLIATTPCRGLSPFR
jgi:membrane protease YdiL (CAAX protease family)